MCKEIYKYSKDGNYIGSFESISHAARYYRVDESSIRKAEGRNCICRGFRWSQEKRDNYFNKTNKDKYSGHFQTRLPKILILDIETAPIRAYVWNIWKQNIYSEQLISDWFIICWSAKWLFDDKVLSERITGDEIKREDDKRIIKKLHSLLNEADIVVAHNGDNFDIPKINSRMLIHGLTPPNPYKTIDTLKIARMQFGFNSNKLDSLAHMFGFEGKMGTDFTLWSRCMDGEEEALEYMETYNRKDVEVLEEVFLKLRPWAKGIPNISLYMDSDKPVCPNCGNSHLSETRSYFYTALNKYKVYTCECGAKCRCRTSEVKTEQRKNILGGV